MLKLHRNYVNFIKLFREINVCCEYIFIIKKFGIKEHNYYKIYNIIKLLVKLLDFIKNIYTNLIITTLIKNNFISNKF